MGAGSERKATPEELARKRAELDRDARGFRLRRLWRVGRIVLVFAVVLGGIAFCMRDRGEGARIELPLTPDGKLDVETWSLFDDGGSRLLKFEIPRSPDMTISERPDKRGFSAVTRVGRARDVPYLMEFAAEDDDSELALGLHDSALRWINAVRAKDETWVFYDSVRDDLDVIFMEDAYPWAVQKKTGHGTRVIGIGFKRTTGAGHLMRGIIFYFRNGVTRYVYRREIPDALWTRGEGLMFGEPGMLVYSRYIDSHWESPGEAELPGKTRSTSDLLYSIRSNLSVDRVGQWRMLHREIDAVLARSWTRDRKTKEIAFGCLKELRELMRAYYWSRINAYRNAKAMKDGDRLAERAREDAKAVFSDPRLRYRGMAYGEEDWQ